jgi:hypothetical protein
MRDKVWSYWPVYILSAGDLEVGSNSLISAPRIGICASNIYMKNARVDSSWKGCPRDRGLGSTPVAEFNSIYCAGAGAAHGGPGGAGGVFTQDKNVQANCAKYFHEPYYYGKEAFYEGSGGTSGDNEKKTGGNGGGIVWMTTPGKTTLDDT